jgi:hypothetical protein
MNCQILGARMVSQSANGTSCWEVAYRIADVTSAMTKYASDELAALTAAKEDLQRRFREIKQ